MADVHGEVAPRFARVRDAFAENFAQRGEVGAAFALYKDGVKVVDLWGGVADEDSGRPWQEDTLQLVFSTTKGATAACAHLLAQRGLLDFDAPVAEYWPEFKQNGKEDIPVRWLFSHRAGLPVVDTPLSPEEMFAWEPAVEALAQQRPYWEPGTKHGYHAVSFGLLVGEVIRRISGKSVGTFFADEIAGPLDADFYLGLPPALEPRVSTIVEMTLGMSDEQREMLRDVDLATLPDDLRRMVEAFIDPDGLSMRALQFTKPAIAWNSPATHAAEVPAGNGIATARGVARMYAGLIGEVDGVRIIDDATIDVARTEQSRGPDAVLVKDTRFGLGYMLDQPGVPLLASGSFGHDGAGGSLGFADPEAGIGFGYVMNKMNPTINGDPRAQALLQAVRASL